MFCLHGSMYTICMFCAYGGQKMEPKLLELGFQIAVNLYVGATN